MITPQYYTIVSGKGEGNHSLVAFDKALLDAGIGDYNLVKVSSILPPKCKYMKSINIENGSILFTAYACKIIYSNAFGSTAVGIALPKNPNENGVIFETSTDDNNAETIVREMCIEAMNNREREIQSITSSTAIITGVPDKYTCALSAVVMW